VNATRWVEGWELIRVSEKCYYFQAGQSQSTQGHGDQPEHQGYSATDYSVAGAGTRLMVLSCIHWGGLSVLGTPPTTAAESTIEGEFWAPIGHHS